MTILQQPSRPSLGDRVVAHVNRYSMCSTGRRLGLAVSGGADSMCLLHILHELAPRWNLHLSVVHIDHGIRGQASSEDAEFVGQAARDLGLPVHIKRADVPGMGGNLEQSARQVRQGFYRELIESGQLDRIATGHTASDQAETVLYRILRGSGLTGLCGIRPVTESGFIRPLLALWRAEIEDWLGERSVAWREDHSNQDLTYARNKLRHVTLPELRQAYNPNLDQTLVQLAVLAQDEEIFWNQTVDRSGAGDSRVGEPVILLASSLAEAPVALSRRLIRRAFERVKGDLRQIEFGHVETVLDMARAGLRPNQGHSRAQFPGLDVIRSFEWIRIAPAGFDTGRPRDFHSMVKIPGSATLPEGGTVTFELIEPEEALHSYDTVRDELDWQRLRSCENEANAIVFELRNWKPGDQYRSSGRCHEEKIKTRFQEDRIPLWERRHWPVVSYQGKILWSRRFGPAADVAAHSGSSKVLRISDPSA